MRPGEYIESLKSRLAKALARDRWLTDLYFECHVTLEPVDGDRLRLLEDVAKLYKFRVADLLMRNGAKNRDDSFCTSRDKTYTRLVDRMQAFCLDLKARGFVVWRYKLENTMMDSKSEGDVLGLL